MREIKFRAWDSQRSIMTRVHKLDLDSEWRRLWETLESKVGITYGISSKFVKLMQYTGLKDKKGVEIYEGDVVRYKDWPKDTHYKKQTIKMENIEGKYCCHLGWNLDTSKCDIEIIGNIYENPELIEKGCLAF